MVSTPSSGFHLRGSKVSLSAVKLAQAINENVMAIYNNNKKLIEYFDYEYWQISMIILLSIKKISPNNDNTTRIKRIDLGE